MWTVLWWKEVRECGLYAGLALLAILHAIGAGMDLPLIPLIDSGRNGEIPFLSHQNFNRQTQFGVIAVVAAIVFGLHQTVWESWRQTTLFLLHRPMPRRDIFLGKLAAGTVLLLAVTAVPLIVYSLWAATPGTHASPFYWSMTEPWWRSVLVAIVCYLGAFLAGIRPALWIGSRTWPAIAVIVLAHLVTFDLPVWTPWKYLILAALIAALLVSILDAACHREYP